MDCLQIVDSRTGSSYNVPIQNHYIRAEDIGQITAPHNKIKNGDDNNHDSSPLRILDTGFQHTACTKSRITLIDGQTGTLRYRDLPIEHLFRNYVYEDVMHLIVWGNLPSQLQKDGFRALMSTAAVPPQSVVNAISSFPKNSDTFPMIVAGLSAFAASDKVISTARHQHKPVFHMNLEVADPALIRAVSYLATTIALIHCHKRGKPFTPPEPGRSLIGNLLLMMDISDANAEKCPDKLWILFADHGMTNSTAAALHAGSTLTDPVSVMISGIVAGYGPLHGGAIDLAYEGFRQIGTPENVPRFIAACKAEKVRLFGYGHRVYQTQDPRMLLVHELMHQYRDAVNSNPLLRVAMAVEKFANEDPYFVEKGLKANVDLMGCFLYTAFGFDEDMIAAISILGRAPGVLAHWRESLTQPIKIWRPQQIYESTLTI